MKSRKLLVLSELLFILAAIFWFWHFAGYDVAAKNKQIMDLVKREYIRDVDISKCEDQMLNGGLSSCLDPFSYYLSAEGAKASAPEVGIGVYVGQDNGLIRVVGIFPGSPADKAGIKKGDVISVVESTSTDKISFKQLAFKISDGMPGSVVNLKVLRDGTELNFSVQRDFTFRYAPLVKYVQLGEVGYIRLANFSNEALPKFERAFLRARKSGSKGIVLDFRGNPGGYLDVMEEIIRHFVREGDMLFYTQARNSKYNQDSRASTDGDSVGIPLVILVNGDSASAAEVFSDILQSWGYAKVVGELTFKKGIAQVSFNLDDGSLLHLTVEELFIGPGGKKLNGVGVAPDYPVSWDGNREDIQMKKAMDVVGELIRKTA